MADVESEDLDEDILEDDNESSDNANDDSDEEDVEDDMENEEKVTDTIEEEDLKVSNIETINIIRQEDWRTSDTMTLYEMVEAIGIRAATIVKNPNLIFIKITNEKNEIEIATREIIEKKVPFTIVREVNRGYFEKRPISLLAIPDDFRLDDKFNKGTTIRDEIQKKINSVLSVSETKE